MEREPYGAMDYAAKRIRAKGVVLLSISITLLNPNRTSDRTFRWTVQDQYQDVVLNHDCYNSALAMGMLIRSIFPNYSY